ncbi:MAG: hypothetical protein WB608_05830 [Terracidiphilus sp.]
MHPCLKEIVVEASQALARLDAARLEELALSCQAFNRMPEPNERAARAQEAGEAAREMAVLGRVLEATRANLRVMKRLQELRAGQLEYAPQQPAAWAAKESSHGDN